MCVRCKCSTPLQMRVEQLYLCPYCLTLTRIEFERGMIALESYLGKWAAFDCWLVAHA